MSVNNHPEFYQSTGNLMLTATKVMEVCANAGVVITDNISFGASVWIDGLQLWLRRRRFQALFYVLQKKMLVEMIMDALTLDAQTVSDLEDVCVGVPPLQFNVPQGATGGNVRYHYKPDFTAHINKQKKYHEEQRREGKALGRGDGDDVRTKWYYFEDVAHLLCARPTISTMQIHVSTATRTG